MNRYKEIIRLLDEKVSVRKVARSLKCSRNTVRDVRDGKIIDPETPKALMEPFWAKQILWESVLKDVRLGHPLKFMWEQQAEDITSYSNFWKYFYKRYPQMKSGVVTLREFEPGERIEVDWAGTKIEWIHPRTKAIHRASIFVAVLGFSQLIFACAKEDQKSTNWLSAHNEMYGFYGGVTSVTVPDCLKQGVAKCHIYDPDINQAYSNLARHYVTAIVPARPYHPKDKAIVEGAVKILMRYFKWRYRDYIFTSISQINEALKVCVEKLNKKPHSRFRVSRRERFEKVEKPKLKSLPNAPYEIKEYKTAKVHPDCHVSVEGNFYSVPHIHRAKEVQVIWGQNLVEIFYNYQRVACHPRAPGWRGRRVTEFSHLPENSKAYRETTPQSLLSQSRFIHQDLTDLLDNLFQQDALGYLRIALGFLSQCRKEINTLGYDKAIHNITKAISQMRRFNKFRVPYFRELLNQAQKESARIEDVAVQRKPNNPMLRNNFFKTHFKNEKEVGPCMDDIKKTAINENMKAEI